MPVTPLEYVGSIHIFLGPYRGNPVALYLRRNGDRVAISPKVYPFNSIVGEAETPNKAAADFEEKWKAKALVAADMYDGPSWEGGIKPERPAPPKPAAPPKPVGDASGAGAKPATPAAGAAAAVAPQPDTTARVVPSAGAPSTTGSPGAAPPPKAAPTASSSAPAESRSPAQTSGAPSTTPADPA